MEILTAAEFAKKWKVSKKAVYTWARAGRLRVWRLGRSIRILDPNAPNEENRPALEAGLGQHARRE